MLYQRNVLNKIKKWYDDDQILLLNGPRQAGKTSVLMKIKEDLEKAGKQAVYLNLEDLTILSDLNGFPSNLLKYASNQTERVFFLLDEIQYLDNPSHFLKQLFDDYKGKAKIIATGSSALEIKAKLQDSLAGRKVSFAIAPLNFEEFLLFKQSPLWGERALETRPPARQEEFIAFLKEYLIYGGMPAVVLQSDAEKKKILLREYVSAYVNKDIRSIGKIDNIAEFNQLVKLLSVQIGNLINLNELGATLKITRRELKKYFDLLNYTYVFDLVRPFSANIRSQITKMPKGYFFDIGIRNQILNNFLPTENRTDAGALFENWLYLELKNTVPAENIYFYRTTNQTGIDFIAQKEGRYLPIEAKFRAFNWASKNRAMEFLRHKNPLIDNGVCVNLNYNQSGDGIRYVDFISFLEELK